MVPGGKLARSNSALRILKEYIERIGASEESCALQRLTVAYSYHTVNSGGWHISAALFAFAHLRFGQGKKLLTGKRIYPVQAGVGNLYGASVEPWMALTLANIKCVGIYIYGDNEDKGR